MKQTDYSPVKDYIEDYWPKILFSTNQPAHNSLRNDFMKIGSISLPETGVSPNHEYFSGTQFYWDSYFTLLGLVDSGRVEEARSVVNNTLSLFHRFGRVPARNSFTSVGRTQPPFLTKMIWEVYDHLTTPDEAWLSASMQTAITEYEHVWGKVRRYSFVTGLSRYQPSFKTAKYYNYESGWDFSTRFANLGPLLIPIDLNSQLYAYETDFIRFAKHIGDKPMEANWRAQQAQRNERVNRFCWDESRHFYFDYNRVLQKPARLVTAAGFFPLWAGLASKKQARLALSKLEILEGPGGIAATQQVPWKKRQWDYPNGWPPLQYIVVKGLLQYGYKRHAVRIARNWCDLNARIYDETGMLWEKYDVINQRIGKDGRYPTQSGFGWTNGVFGRLAKVVETNGEVEI